MKKKSLMYFSIYTINTLGTWIRFVVTPLFIYKITGSFINSGISSILAYSTKLILMPLISPYIEKFNKEKVVSASSLAQSILVISYTLTKNIYIIYLITMGLSVCSNISSTGCIVIVKKWFGKSELKKVNSILTTIGNIFVCIGPALGGLLADKYGFIICFFIDGISYLIFSILIFLARQNEIETTNSESTICKSKISIHGFKKYYEIIKYIGTKKKLIKYVISVAFLWIGVECVLLLYPILCNDITSSPNGYGVFWSVIGVGQLLGGILVIKFKNKDTAHVYYYSILFSGVFHIFLFFSKEYLLALLIVGVATIGDGISIVLDDCIVQEEVEDKYIFMFVTCLQAIISISSLVGSSITVLLQHYVHYRIIGIIAGAFLIISSLVGIIDTKEANYVVSK